MEQIYDVELNVPLGIRKGTMKCEIQEEHVSGHLEILGNATDFQGTCMNGLMKITGQLKTFVRKIPYEGSGTIRSGVLQLQLHSGKAVYELTGQLRK